VTRNDLIFSHKPLSRFSRHLLLLSIFGGGFYLQSIGEGPDKFYAAFISLVCFFPVCMLVCYASMYLLVPRLLHKKRYIAFVASFVLLLLGALVVNFFLSYVYYAFTCQCVESEIPLYKVFGLGFINMTHAVVISGFVLGIKFSKNWYLQRKDNQVMARQKILRELQLQRSRLYPGFIFHSMQRLHDKINTNSPDAPGILLKLSELLSYILYESEETLVTVEQEIEIMQHLVELEKINQPGCINDPIIIAGNTHNLYIRPMSLFTILQNCFGATGSPQSICPCSFAIQVSVEKRQLQMLVTITPTSQNKEEPIDWSSVLAKTRHEWELVQATHYKLSTTEKNNITTLLLTLDLASEPVSKEQPSTINIQPGAYEFA
jgi:hypothetical protein